MQKVRGTKSRTELLRAISPHQPINPPDLCAQGNLSVVVRNRSDVALRSNYGKKT